MNIAAHRFNNDLRYRDDAHPMQRQLTPGYVLEPIRKALGSIELDPCTEPDNPTRATMFYTPPVDGADEPWDAATIYVNPPYSKARERWVNRCIEAAATGSSVALLMPSHTDTRLFHRAIGTASHVVFIRGRVKFGVLRSNRRQEAASHPSCVILWNVADVSPMAHLGAVWTLSEVADAIDGVTLDDVRFDQDEHALEFDRAMARRSGAPDLDQGGAS